MEATLPRRYTILNFAHWRIYLYCGVYYIMCEQHYLIELDNGKTFFGYYSGGRIYGSESRKKLHITGEVKKMTPIRYNGDCCCCTII